jgi:predicted Zn-dependent peptidase
MRGTALTLACVLTACASRPALPKPAIPLAATPNTPLRQAPPAAADSSPLVVPNITTFILENGLTVRIVERPAAPFVHALLVRAHTFASAKDYELSLAAAQYLSFRPWHDRREPFEYGIPDATTASLTVPVNQVASAIKSLSAVPEFTDEEATTFREVLERQIRRHSTQLPIRTAGHTLRDLFGPEYPLGAHPLEKRDRIDAYGNADFSDAVKKQLAPDESALILVGAVTRAEVEPAVRRFFGSLPKAGAKRLANPSPSRERATVVYLLQTPVAGGQLTLSAVGPEHGAKRRVAFDLAVRCLAGVDFSRLERALRNELQAIDSFATRKHELSDTWSVFIRLQPDRFREIVEAVYAELARFAREGPTAEELERARARELESLASSLEGSIALATALGRLHIRQEGPEEWLHRDEALRSTTLADVARAARDYLEPDMVSFAAGGDVTDMAAQMQWSKIRTKFVPNY